MPVRVLFGMRMCGGRGKGKYIDVSGACILVRVDFHRMAGGQLYGRILIRPGESRSVGSKSIQSSQKGHTV